MRCSKCGSEIYGDNCPNCAGTLTSSARRSAVRQARDRWVEKLIDLSRRNKLLYVRETKTGTLDCSRFDHNILHRLMAGETIALSEIVPDLDEAVSSARAKEIKQIAKANFEEKNLATLYVAVGFASWSADDGGRATEAPVLLVPVAFEKQGRESRSARLKFNGDELLINDVMLFALAQQQNVRVPSEELLPLNEAKGEVPLSDVFLPLDRLTKSASRIKDFQLIRRASLSNFSYQKMSMVRDLLDGLEQMSAHDLIAAIAGDTEAKENIRSQEVSENPQDLDRIPPNQEFLVLNADSTQQVAITSALALQSGVIHGPPGTGKSQTIANLIAEFAARGKRVLFVAEKRVALQVVLDRLQQLGLSHLALDLHGSGITRKAVMDQFAESLRVVHEAPDAQYEDLHRRFTERRGRLNDHVARLHVLRSPSNLSIFQMQGRLLHFAEDERSNVRWRGIELGRLSTESVEEAGTLLTELAGFENLFLRTEPSPWTNAPLKTGQLVELAVDCVRRVVNEDLPALSADLSELAGSGVPVPDRLADIDRLFKLLEAISQTLAAFAAEIYKEGLESLSTALKPAARKYPALKAWLFNSKYRDALRQARQLRCDGEKSRRTLLRGVEIAGEQLREWREFAPNSSPQVPDRLPKYRRDFTQLREAVGQLQALLSFRELDGRTLTELDRISRTLAADSVTPYQLPRLLEIEQRLHELGFAAIVAELRAKKPDARKWPRILDHAWLSSCRERTLIEDNGIAGFDGAVHQKIRDEFCTLDSDRLKLSVQRVLRKHAEHAVAVMNEHHDQEDLLRLESQRKFKRLPLRKLMERAPDLLMALRPCWMMSPLSVSELIPARKYLDVVLFDEASQILPEDAIPALMRARNAVVAGDENQLPPTTFFDAAGVVDGDDGAGAAVSGFDSFLEQMLGLFRPWSLDWHYRSLDESLIAFSNRYIYQDRLITFPGAGRTPALSHVLVNSVAPQAGQEESSSEEVRKVTELVLKHANERPHETLGVIAMGIKHAQRAEAAIDYACLSHPELEEFFSDENKERFFVKNLERVQGDERDSIILTVGYGRDSNGRLPYRFGPLNNQGGEHRLNVAITRARRRMTIVSSFDDRDMDPNRSTAEGVRLLRLYLEYARNRGQRFGDRGQSFFPENSFEADVHRALQAKGIDLIPQYGVSGYRIDLVAKHPKEPGRCVLAIECDGASYHSAYTARDRDRLRQQQLEALGWRFHRIWSTDWFNRRAAEIDRAVTAYNSAVTYANRIDSSDGRPPSPPSSTPPPRAPRSSTPNGSVQGPQKLRGRRPSVPSRSDIGQYAPRELDALADWIASDGRLRSDREMRDELVQELGFKRLGARIEAAIEQALERYHRKLS